ncbi:HPF/RaiA family ribosome-associated protein [Salinarimonas chemoclinalis]|uniref:HPF/RaiA family ribosome-associated protein n=1 Tax=Salinarimonas chemoclinalis TaxID=3241599 RepID=UPI00355600F0
MQVQVNTDSSIVGDDALAGRVETAARDALGRFEERITRLEIHLTDVNGAKPGPNDKRCVIEVRPAGRRPETVTDDAGTIDAAVSGALQKLRRVLDGTLGRLDDHKGAPSIRTGI